MRKQKNKATKAPNKSFLMSHDVHVGVELGKKPSLYELL